MGDMALPALLQNDFAKFSDSQQIISSLLLKNDSMNFTESQQASSLLEKLQSQRESGRFCDVVLHVQGKRFYAHRSVLAACSPYFDSVLKMHKAVREQLIIACQSQEIFQLLLNFMYTGTIHIDKENVSELLRLANHFLVTKLKTYCAEFLERNMNLANCLSVKEMAEKYTLPSLLKSASDYIHDHMKDVLEHSDLVSYKLTEVEKFLSEKSGTISYDFLLRFIARWVGYDVVQRERDLRRLLTFLDFRSFDQNMLVEYLQKEPLYKENNHCLFYFLQCLKENRVLPNQLEASYQSLKEEFKSMTEKVDKTAFMNIAISAAIEGVHSKVPEPISAECEVSSYDAIVVTPIKSTPQMDNQSGDEDVESRKNCSEENGNNSSIVSNYTQDIDPPKTARPQRAAALRQRNEFIPVHVPKPKIKTQPASEPKKVMTTSYITKVTPAETKETPIPKRRPGRPPKNPKPRIPTPEPEIEEPEDFDDDMEIIEDEDEDDEEFEYTIEIKSDIDDDDISTDEEEEDDFLASKRKRDPLVLRWRDGIKCPLCVFTAFTFMRMEQHVSRVHSKEITYKCTICGFTCKWNKEYYRHMRTHFVGPPYNCQLCDYSCDRIQFILSHRMKHTDERPYRCGECKFTSRTKSNLIVHMRCHTGEKPFQCKHCGKHFATKTAHVQHVQGHRKDRPFHCDVCGFATKYQSHLISHMRVHSGDVFYCDFPNCNYSSPKRSQVNAHQRTHTAVRSHVCGTCGRGFVERSHLVRHERIHLNDKPFKCLECDYSSSRRDKLKEHIQKHHGENATAKAPYKPRRPRRQNFDPAFYPPTQSMLLSAHKMMLHSGRRPYPMIGPHPESQEIYCFENPPGLSSNVMSEDHLRHPGMMHHRPGATYERREDCGLLSRDHCGLMAPRERIMSVVPEGINMGHPRGNAENQPPDHVACQQNETANSLSAFMPHLF